MGRAGDGRLCYRRQRCGRDHRTGGEGLLKWGEASATAAKALNYIASEKDERGAWSTTQATIMALRAILLSTEKGAADVRGNVEISLNGKPAGKLALTAENNDLLHQFALAGVDAQGANRVDIRFDGKAASPTRWWAAISSPGTGSRRMSRFRSP